MQQQKLCLKWNNHTVNLLSELQSYQQKDVLVDVTISCEGRNIKAHKMILSACSPYFQSIFSENPCQHPIVIINGMKYEDITSILNFMYKGEVNVSHDGLSSFLQAAEALKVKGLAEVCGEKKSATANSQESESTDQVRPPQTDTPTKKRHRNRKRSISDDESAATSRKQHKEPNSPEIHELSGDEAYVGDMSSNGQSVNSRVSHNVYSRPHQSSSVISHVDEMDDDYEIEPSKLLEQTLTTENVSMNNTSSDNSLRIERIMGNATDMDSSNLQEPESPPDIKPLIEYGESSAGTSDGTMVVYNEQSQPGPSSVQDSSLVHDNSPTQGFKNGIPQSKLNRCYIKQKSKNIKKFKYDCTVCEFTTCDRMEIAMHLKKHAACRMKTDAQPPCNENPMLPSNTFRCFQCSYKTESETNIRNHLFSHANSLHICQKCKRKFNTLASLKIHHTYHKNQNELTKTVASSTQTITKNNATVQQQNSNPVFSCCYCDEVFASKVGLICHKDNIHKYKCSAIDCNKVFFDRAAFEEHMASHEN